MSRGTQNQVRYPYDDLSRPLTTSTKKRMLTAHRTRNTSKNMFLPKRLTCMLKRRAISMNKRVHAIKAELAARTLYVVDGEEIVM